MNSEDSWRLYEAVAKWWDALSDEEILKLFTCRLLREIFYKDLITSIDVMDWRWLRLNFPPIYNLMFCEKGEENDRDSNQKSV
mgnify:FL=1